MNFFLHFKLNKLNKTVYVVSLFNIDKQQIQTAFNDYFKASCEKYSIRFIDTYTLTTDHFKNDHIHLNGKGFKYLRG